MNLDPTVQRCDYGTVCQTDDECPCYQPAADVLEHGEGVTLHLDMPGVSRDRLDITFEQGILTVSGQSQLRRREDAARRRIAEEFAPGAYYRTFRVGNIIDSAGITAEMADGVLTLRLPRAAASRPRKIEVAVA
jgi:HSP20 family protein